MPAIPTVLNVWLLSFKIPVLLIADTVAPESTRNSKWFCPTCTEHFEFSVGVEALPGSLFPSPRGPSNDYTHLGVGAGSSWCGGRGLVPWAGPTVWPRRCVSFCNISPDDQSFRSNSI